MSIAEHRDQSTSASTTVAEIERYWREILRIDEQRPIDPTHSFFEYGGSSLQAVALAARLSDRFRIDITALTIVDHPGVAQLGQYIDAQIQDFSDFGEQDEGLL